MNIDRARIAQSMAAAEYRNQNVTRHVWMVSNDYQGFSERAKIEQEAAAFFARMARQAMGIERPSTSTK